MGIGSWGRGWGDGGKKGVRIWGRRELGFGSWDLGKKGVGNWELGFGEEKELQVNNADRLLYFSEIETLLLSQHSFPYSSLGTRNTATWCASYGTLHSFPHSALSTQHSALFPPLSTQHSALSTLSPTQHSALSTQHCLVYFLINREAINQRDRLAGIIFNLSV
uniref:Uncharacterized protein n=1 Tax=Desertifilum tharense IPPAS B-1220 TaxID=1781255 RepID=A0ACD5H0J4_9CYAN